MRHRYALVVVLLALVAACKSPRVSYVTAETSFKTLVAFTNDRIEDGSLPMEKAKEFKPYINAANAALENWLEVLLETPEGQKPNVPVALVNTVLDTLDILEAYYLQQTRGG